MKPVRMHAQLCIDPQPSTTISPYTLHPASTSYGTTAHTHINECAYHMHARAAQRPDLTVRGHHVALLANLDAPAALFPALSAAYVMPSLFPASFSLAVPFFAAGTTEDLSEEGQVGGGTADP